MGFLQLTQGKIRIGGISVREAQQQQLRAYMPQSDEVDSNFSINIYDVVMMGRYGYMNLLRISSAQDRCLVMESLERFEMSDFRHHQICELSGGQKNRAFLARALAQKGKVFLLDEPFTGVDIKTEKRIIYLLLQLREEGHTISISTHDLASISSFCDRIILLNQTILASRKTEKTLTEENLEMTFNSLSVNNSLSPMFYKTEEDS